MLNELTKEQEDLMTSIASKWKNQLHLLPQINKKQCIEGVEWLYQTSKLHKPHVFFCTSILEAQILIKVLKSDNVSANVSANVSDNVWDNVMANVWDNVRDNVMANVRDNVLDNVRANVRANVMDNVRANVRDNVLDNVRANVSDNVLDNVRANVESLCHCGDIQDYGWVSFYDYFAQIGVLKDDNFNKFSKMLQSGYFTMIQLRGYCFVIQNPKFIKMENNQMHSLSGNAIEFNDGWGMNFIQGRYLPPNTYNNLLDKKYTFDDFIKEENEEYKSTILLYIQLTEGDNGLFNFLSTYMKKVDTYVDEKDAKFLINTKGMNVGLYDLFKGQVGSIELSAIRCYCPSTDRMFFLFCENTYNNAKDAIGSLCRIPRKLKDELLYLQRQGERFSAVWTENGKIIKTTMTTKDYQDVVPLSGNEYFAKMRFEY